MLYLTLDQGGQSSRALIFDGAGDVRARARVAVGASAPRSGWLEQEPEALVASLVQAGSQAMQQLGAARDQVFAAGLSVQRSNVVCWDRITGEALTPAISWQDLRGQGSLVSLPLGRAVVKRRTGLYPSPHYGASKLSWALQHLPAVRRAARRGRLVMGPLAAFLVAHLCRGRPCVVAPSIAQRTLLWSWPAGGWDEVILQAFGLAPTWMPDLVPSQGDHGELALAGQGIPLRLLMGDQAAALFAHGRPGRNSVSVNLGTGGFLQRSTDHHPCLLAGLVSSHLGEDAEGPLYGVEATVNGAGCAIGMSRDSPWPVREVERQGRSGLQVRGGRGAAPVFVNAVAGLGSPWWRADVTSHFVGARGADQASKQAAVLESVAFMVTANLQRMDRVLGKAELITITGGLSRLDALCRALARLSGHRLVRPPEQEATARGLAWWLAGQPAGWGYNPRISAWFEPGDDRDLNWRYRRWRAAIAAALRRGPCPGREQGPEGPG